MKTTTELEPLLSVRHVARYLDVSDMAVLHLATLGGLPAVRLSRGTLRFSPDALKAWVAERTALRTPGGHAPQALGAP